MSVDWEGANSKSSWGYGGFKHMKWMILLGALRIVLEPGQAEEIENIEDLEDYGDLQMDNRIKLLPENDPIRKFLRQPERGKLSPVESRALAARLAEIIYFLTTKRKEHERFIFLPHMARLRQFQDDQFSNIALLMWECAAAAEKGIEISWDAY